MNGCSAIDQKEKTEEDKWTEVMKLAEEYGFIRFAYGGFAMLSIDEETMKKQSTLGDIRQSERVEFKIEK